MTSEFKWNEGALSKLQKNITEALWDLGFEAEAHAKSAAPVGVYPKKSGRVGGALVNSIRVHKTKNQVVILAGGTIRGKYIPYARFREYNNNLHPNTRFYMKNALQWANDNVDEYFKDVTKNL